MKHSKSLFRLVSLFLSAFILITPASSAWQLQGSDWVGADDMSGDVPYGLKFTRVEAIEKTGFVFEIEGFYKSGFSDHGDCTKDWYPLRGYYYEPTATIAFSVIWYNQHNVDCRTTNTFMGYIQPHGDLALTTVERYPGTPPSQPGTASWDIVFERQVGEDQ